MKELKKYETCEIEIIAVSNDVITSSQGIVGPEDKLEW